MWEIIKLYTSNVWGFLKPFVKIFISSIGPILISAATAAVKAQMDSDATGGEKRDAAFDAIRADLKTQGITVGVNVATSAVYAAIEAAVQKVKES